MFSCACPTVTSSIFGKNFHFPFPYFVLNSLIFDKTNNIKTLIKEASFKDKESELASNVKTVIKSALDRKRNMDIYMKEHFRNLEISDHINR